MNYVLITGGCGFIGSNFVHEIVSAGQFHPVVLDKLSYAGNLNNLNMLEKNTYTFIKGDICDGSIINELFEKYKFIAVFHFAAESHVDRSIDGPRSFIYTNIIGTFNLLQATRNNLNKIDDNFKFIHISTDEVFGSLKLNNSKFNLKSSYDPKSPYSASKASSDHLVRAYGNTFGLKFNIINCSNNFGERQHVEKLIPKTITNAFKNKKIPIYGNGKNIRDWIYVKDFCRAIYKVLIKSENKKTYLVGSNQLLKLYGWNQNYNLITGIKKTLNARK